MVTAARAAVLIAAISFAVLTAAGVYTLVKLSRLISQASRVVADWRARSDLLVGRADAAVERAHEQLARTDQITASMDEVTANIAELTADVSMLTRAVHTLFGGPLHGLAGFAFGLRRAVALARAGRSARVRDSAAHPVAPDARPPNAVLPGPALASGASKPLRSAVAGPTRRGDRGGRSPGRGRPAR